MRGQVLQAKSWVPSSLSTQSVAMAGIFYMGEVSMPCGGWCNRAYFMEISKSPEILGGLSMRKQCIPGSFSPPMHKSLGMRLSLGGLSFLPYTRWKIRVVVLISSKVIIQPLMQYQEPTKNIIHTLSPPSPILYLLGLVRGGHSAEPPSYLPLGVVWDQLSPWDREREGIRITEKPSCRLQ